MGAVLIQVEFAIPRKHLRRIVVSIWITLFSQVTKVTIVGNCMEPESNPRYSDERHVHKYLWNDVFWDFLYLHSQL